MSLHDRYGVPIWEVRSSRRGNSDSKLVADEAVECEPISEAEFPDIREKYREFAQKYSFVDLWKAIRCVNSKGYGEFPLAFEQGIFWF